VESAEPTILERLEVLDFLAPVAPLALFVVLWLFVLAWLIPWLNEGGYDLWLVRREDKYWARQVQKSVARDARRSAREARRGGESS
jgi:lipopolysaccharide export LptBFGC system permease protein LptF